MPSAANKKPKLRPLRVPRARVELAAHPALPKAAPPLNPAQRERAVQVVQQVLLPPNPAQREQAAQVAQQVPLPLNLVQQERAVQVVEQQVAVPEPELSLRLQVRPRAHLVQPPVAAPQADDRTFGKSV